MSKEGKRYVFGPVPSRRLGRSLGIDLVPFKTCTYDCVYCQLGRTTRRTSERAEYAPAGEVLRQLEQALASGAAPDVITLAGSGEPCLHRRLGEIVAGIKRLTPVPLAVLTNGSLLFRPEARAALLGADLVAPDLDAASEAAWRAVCRPDPALDFGRVLAGLEAFAGEYRGRLELEVFLVAGMNDGEEEVQRIAAVASRLPGAQVRLNTLTRPGAEACARRVALDRLAELARLFEPAAGLIPELEVKPAAAAAACAADIRELVSRHPATLPEIAASLGLDLARAQELVAELLLRGEIAETVHEGRTFYK